MADQIKKIEYKYFQVPNDIFELSLKPIEIAVYMYLVRCGNNSTAFPSYSTIGKKVSISRDCAINTVKKLIEKKLVIKHERTKDIKKKKDQKIVAIHDSNIYEVVVNLDSLVVENDQGGNPQRLGVVVENDQGGNPQRLGVVVENDQGGNPQRLGVVVENDPKNNYIKKNYEEELKEEELFKNISSSQQKNEPDNQQSFSVESKDSTSKEDKPKKPKKVTIFSPESVELRASKYLFEKMCENNPNAKVPDFQKWADYIRLMIEQDKRDPKLIAKVIEFSQKDDFWKANILSTKKLREKYEQLYLKMNSQVPQNNKKSELDKMKNVYEMAKKLDEERKRRNM
jgi:predicted transcriptional regulator